MEKVKRVYEKAKSLEFMRKNESGGQVLLRLRGFLHAFHLVEMTIYFYHHNALQGISSATAHIERFSVYRKSLKGFISTRVSTRNKVLLRLRGFLHNFTTLQTSPNPFE